jgi:hypothetical protein
MQRPRNNGFAAFDANFNVLRLDFDDEHLGRNARRDRDTDRNLL